MILFQISAPAVRISDLWLKFFCLRSACHFLNIESLVIGFPVLSQFRGLEFLRSLSSLRLILVAQSRISFASP